MAILFNPGQLVILIRRGQIFDSGAPTTLIETTVYQQRARVGSWNIIQAKTGDQQYQGNHQLFGGKRIKV